MRGWRGFFLMFYKPFTEISPRDVVVGFVILFLCFFNIIYHFSLLRPRKTVISGKKNPVVNIYIYIYLMCRGIKKKNKNKIATWIIPCPVGPRCIFNIPTALDCGH